MTMGHVNIGILERNQLLSLGSRAARGHYCRARRRPEHRYASAYTAHHLPNRQREATYRYLGPSLHPRRDQYRLDIHVYH